MMEYGAFVAGDFRSTDPTAKKIKKMLHHLSHTCHHTRSEGFVFVA